jgi:hypothetical protein
MEGVERDNKGGRQRSATVLFCECWNVDISMSCCI